MLCGRCGVEMEPMTHLRENCLENQIENLDSQLTDVCTLRTHLEALEKWGREVVEYLVYLERIPPMDTVSWCLNKRELPKLRKAIAQARTLGLVEEKP